MQQFEITLKNEKIRLYDRFALFIFLLNGIAIILTLLYLPVKVNISNWAGIWISLAVLQTILPACFLLWPKSPRFWNTIHSATLSIILFWIGLGYWWVAVLVAMLILLYTMSKRQLVVTVDDHKISYPSFPNRNIAWHDLNNLILKDRILTIDFRDNKLIQQDIDSKSYHVNEQEFNDFCKQQLQVK